MRTDLDSRRWNLVGAGLIVLVTLLVYLPAVRAGFVWDDNRYLTANTFVQSAQGLPHIWFSGDTRDFYPVLYSSFWLEWRLWGANPLGYHLVNILLHAANAVLVWLLLRQLRLPGAWLCGMIFAVHPLNVESVAWISQRKNTLAMLFYLLSSLAYLRWHTSRRCVPYSTALVLFALSLLTKPIAIMFPFIIPLFHWWQRRAGLPTTGMSHTPALTPHTPGIRQVLLEMLPFLVLSGMYGVMTVIFQQAHSIQDVTVGAVTPAGRVILACKALLFYIYKTVWPLNLCAIYPEWKTSGFGAVDFLPGLVLLLTVVLLLKHRDEWGRPLLFAVSYFVLMLFPVLGLADVGFMFYAMVSDHWIYPAIPALIAVIVGALKHCGISKPGMPTMAKITGTALVCAGLLAMSLLTYRQCHVYRDLKTLFTDTVHSNPHAWAAHVVLGNIAFSENALVEAQDHYQTALRDKPDYWEAQNGLGIVFAVQGQLDEAIRMFNAVLAAKPEHASARRNLKLAMKEKGAVTER